MYEYKSAVQTHVGADGGVVREELRNIYVAGPQRQILFPPVQIPAFVLTDPLTQGPLKG